MAVLRKIALGLLLAASAAGLVMAGWELWINQQWAYLPLSAPSAVLQNRMDLLTKRVGDMELLVLILLGTSSLYAIVLVLSSYFSTTSFARRADQTISHIQDQIGLAMGDLRELQEETEQRLRQMTAARTAETPERPAAWEAQIAEITARLAAWRDAPLSEHARLELVRDE